MANCPLREEGVAKMQHFIPVRKRKTRYTFPLLKACFAYIIKKTLVCSQIRGCGRKPRKFLSVAATFLNQEVTDNVHLHVSRRKRVANIAQKHEGEPPIMDLFVARHVPDQRFGA